MHIFPLAPVRLQRARERRSRVVTWARLLCAWAQNGHVYVHISFLHLPQMRLPQLYMCISSLVEVCDDVVAMCSAEHGMHKAFFDYGPNDPSWSTKAPFEIRCLHVRVSVCVCVCVQICAGKLPAPVSSHSCYVLTCMQFVANAAASSR